MTDTRAAKRYARALFQAALKQNSVAEIDSDLAGLVAVISGSSRLKTFLFSPVTNDKDKLTLLDRTFGSSVNALTMQALRLLVTKKRDHEIFAIQLEYAALRRDHEKIIKAVIESAAPLDDAQRNAIVAKIGSATGLRVDPQFEIDEKLIGGVKVTYGDYVLDGSVRGHLDRMRDTLMRDLLKQS